MEQSHLHESSVFTELLWDTGDKRLNATLLSEIFFLNADGRGNIKIRGYICLKNISVDIFV